MKEFKQMVVKYQRPFIFIGMLFCFAFGWFLQSGWVEEQTVDTIAPGQVRIIPSETMAQTKTEDYLSFRLDRDREHGRQRERLQELLLSAEPDSDWAREVEQELLGLERQVNYEHQLENTLAARGYQETAVSVEKNTVTIVVPQKTLTQEQVSLIGQWAADITGFSIDRIRIVDQS